MAQEDRLDNIQLEVLPYLSELNLPLSLPSLWGGAYMPLINQTTLNRFAAGIAVRFATMVVFRAWTFVRVKSNASF